MLWRTLFRSPTRPSDVLRSKRVGLSDSTALGQRPFGASSKMHHQTFLLKPVPHPRTPTGWKRLDTYDSSAPDLPVTAPGHRTSLRGRPAWIASRNAAPRWTRGARQGVVETARPASKGGPA